MAAIEGFLNAGAERFRALVRLLSFGSDGNFTGWMHAGRMSAGTELQAAVVADPLGLCVWKFLTDMIAFEIRVGPVEADLMMMCRSETSILH